MKRKAVLAVMIVLILCMGLFAGCGQKDSAEAGGPPEIEGLTFDHEMELAYADQFHVYYYNDDYQVITVEGGDSYILIPEGGEVPAGTPEEMVIIEKPVDRIYLAASSAMALFNAMDALDTIAFSGTKADGWYIDAAKEAMDSGKITFAGKYSAPDYEMLLDEGCDLIVCTGGMSVDPDDRTPLAIRNVCGSAVTYGAPVLPGAMFMLAYYGENSIPVMGLPGCVMYARRTIFDIVLPRVMTGEILEKKDFDVLGEGGLCLSCEVCTFPNCGFGK